MDVVALKRQGWRVGPFPILDVIAQERHSSSICLPSLLSDDNTEPFASVNALEHPLPVLETIQPLPTAMVQEHPAERIRPFVIVKAGAGDNA